MRERNGGGGGGGGGGGDWDHRFQLEPVGVVL